MYPLKESNEYIPEGYTPKYQDFVDAVVRMEKHYSLPKNAGTPAEMFTEVWCLHPEIFWLRNSFNYQVVGDNYEVNLYYTCPKFIAQIRQLILNFKINSIVNKASSYPNAIEKLRFLHDTLKEKSYYTKITKSCGTSYGCIVEGEALCQGYTNAFTMLARKCGIVCGPVLNADHVWNYVVVDGKEYMIDLTWDDAKGIRSSTPYKYFMITKEKMSEDHLIGTDYYDYSLKNKKHR